MVPFVVVGERGTGGELPVTLLSYARDICRGINFPSALGRAERKKISRGRSGIKGARPELRPEIRFASKF